MKASKALSGSRLTLLKLGGIGVSLFYFGLTVDYLVLRGSPAVVSVIAAIVWTALIAGIAVSREHKE